MGQKRGVPGPSYSELFTVKLGFQSKSPPGSEKRAGEYICLFSEHITLDQMVTEWCPDPPWDTSGQYQCLLGS